MTSYLLPFWSYRRLLFKFWTLRFWATLWGLGATYAVHLRLIGMLTRDFLFVLIELFSLHVTAEVLPAKIDWKSAFCKGVGELRTNFRITRGRPPPTITTRIDRPINALQFCRWRFSYKETSRLSSSEVQFYTENGLLRCWSFFGSAGPRTMFILGSLESA